MERDTAPHSLFAVIASGSDLALVQPLSRRFQRAGLALVQLLSLRYRSAAPLVGEPLAGRCVFVV